MMVRAVAMSAVAAMVAVAPADARDRRQHRGGGDGVAAFVAGAVIAGGLVALLAGKNQSGPPADVAAEPTVAENDAVNRCADAAERSMIDDGREARVERIASVIARDGGGYKVKGDIRVADPGDGYMMRFSCTAKGSDVRSMTLSI